MLKTFKLGGIHPPENKLSSQEAIIVLPLPEQVIIPLSQHIGAPAVPIVKRGDQVKTGQLIAKSAGFISANIHSSISGTVMSIEPILDSSGYSRPAITIKREGDEWSENILQTSAQQASEFKKEDILTAIQAAGVVGMGGATFPTNVKLSPPPGNTAELLIINGVECEPYLTSDHRLMLEKCDELITGTEFLVTALGVKRAVIGIENNKPNAIASLREVAKKRFSSIEIVPLKVKYPQGGEKQLIKAITGKSVPSGQLPISVGAVVQNVGTVFAVYEAVMFNKPLIERIVTITGKSVKRPGNYLCRIGTSISALIEAAGGLPEDSAKIIAGGPMMGKTLASPDIPLTKGSSGILILSEQEAYRKPFRACIRCTKCIQVCPMGLEPYLLMTLSEWNKSEELEQNRVLDCIECGSCSYTCPANRPLLDLIRLGKARTTQMIRNRKS